MYNINALSEKELLRIKELQSLLLSIYKQEEKTKLELRALIYKVEKL